MSVWPQLSPAEVRRRQSRRAAQALGAGAPGDLDLRLLLRDLPADAEIRWIRFLLPAGEEISVSRRLLRQVGTESRRRHGRMKAGLRAWVDTGGLQLRWATGGLTLRAILDPSEDIAPSLRVDLAQRQREAS